MRLHRHDSAYLNRLRHEYGLHVVKTPHPCFVLMPPVARARPVCARVGHARIVRVASRTARRMASALSLVLVHDRAQLPSRRPLQAVHLDDADLHFIAKAPVQLIQQ